MLKSDKYLILSIIKKYGRLFTLLDNDLKKNKEIVLVAVNNYGLILEYVPEELKNNVDSTRYQYKPQPAKPAELKKVTASVNPKVLDNRPINMTNLLLGKLIL